MNRIFSATVLVGLVALSALAQTSPTLTIVNQAGDPATVHIVGPSAGYIDVSSGATKTVSISGGTYRLKIRYCNGGRHCRYSETDSFNVVQTYNSVSRITVTLHSVGGNLNERGISESEFNGGN